MQHTGTVTMMTMVDPYLYEMLLRLTNGNVVIQTTRNPLQGQLMHVMPDHVVINVAGVPFYVRISEIIWVTTATEKNNQTMPDSRLPQS